MRVDLAGRPTLHHRVLVEADAPPPPGAAPVYPLARFLASPSGDAVRLAPGDDAAALVPHLPGLQLIEIAFPAFRDGRGYSTAQLLRRRYGYTGGLCAVGQVLRDQIGFMARCGFDAFEIDAADVAAIVRAALAEYAVAYQPAADRAPLVWSLRRTAGPAARSVAQRENAL